MGRGVRGLSHPLPVPQNLREVSLFTAGGGGANLKIACTQNTPPLEHMNYVFAPSCTEILPPSTNTLICIVSYHIILDINTSCQTKSLESGKFGTKYGDIIMKHNGDENF